MTTLIQSSNISGGRHPSFQLFTRLERREPYNPILEVSIGYAGAAAVAVMDEVAFVNERQDKRMEGIEESALGLLSRVTSAEDENCQLRAVVRKLDLSHLCFSLNFFFLMFLSQFPSMFPLLTYSQSFLSPYLLITRDTQDEGEARFNSTSTGTV